MTRFHRRSAFTLVELLVVIGIIAVLISLLLPSLNTARRSARRLQCLASLREIGNGFQMYSNAYKGVYPIAGWRPPSLASDRWYGWMHQILPFISGLQHTATRGELGTNAHFRKNSVLWGCPEWTKNLEYDSSASSISAEMNYTGYGMQYYPSYFDDGNKLSNLAIMTAEPPPGPATPGVQGRWVKQSVWAKKSSERGLVGCATVEFVRIPVDFPRSTVWYSPFENGFPALNFDSTRHLKTGFQKIPAQREKGLNLLFVDGHAESVSIIEAWMSCRAPGSKDLSTP